MGDLLFGPRSRIRASGWALATLCTFLLGAGALRAATPVVSVGSTQGVDGTLRLYFGATFHTGAVEVGGEDIDGPSRTVEALLVRDGRILALGEFHRLLALPSAAGAEHINLGGSHGFPGFQDSHGYLEWFGASLEEVDLADAKDFDEVIARVAEFAGSLPDGEWVLGQGWDETGWKGAGYPNHGPLSEAVPSHPVFIQRSDGEVGLANTAAMVAAGIEDDELRRTGIFRGAAKAELEAHVPAPSRAARRRRLLRAQDVMLRHGLTAVHEMGLDTTAIELLMELRASGSLKLRVVGYLQWPEAGDGFTRESLAKLSDRHDVFSIAGVVFQMDGGFGSRGAALLAPYTDAPGEKGQALWTADELGRILESVVSKGLQPAVRATGDRGVHLALDAFALTAQRTDELLVARPRLEHLQLVDGQELARWNELGVIASMQPEHLVADLPWLNARLGKLRAGRAYPWQTLRKSAPGRLSFGSAFPLASPDPMRGFHAALTRQTVGGDPQGGFHASECLSASQLIFAYTGGAAVAARQEDRRGRLALGYAADFTVFDADISLLTASTAGQALTASVLATVINGEVVYRRP